MRSLLAALLAGAFLGAATLPTAAAPPVVFVHGDGDTAALWQTQIWRFETNGYPRDRLFAVDLHHPSARSDDGAPQENRSSTTDVASQLAGFVARVMLETGEPKVVLVGNSRGCNTIRNYVHNAGGAANAALLVLTGCVNHGIFVLPDQRLGSEYNGAGPFLAGLNAVSEVLPGLPTITIRSDRFDKFAQPVGDLIGMPGQPTGVSYDGPELRGAHNIVLEGVDHRETAYSAAAFEPMFQVVAGRPPAAVEIAPEAAPVLDGKVTGWANERPTNLPLAGARVAVYATNPESGERLGPPVHEATVGSDGLWGPFNADPEQTYEFFIETEGYPPHHIYRSPFPRSSRYVNLRLYPAAAEAEGGGAVVSMMRPRGYFGGEGNSTELDGEPAPGIPEGVPTVWQTAKTVEAAEPVTVVGRFNEETIAARTWPEEPSSVVWIELTH